MVLASILPTNQEPKYDESVLGYVLFHRKANISLVKYLHVG